MLRSAPAELPSDVCDDADDHDREGLGKGSRNAGGQARTSSPMKPTRRSAAAGQDSFQRWWASSRSTLAHVKKCGKLRRTAGACEARFFLEKANNAHGPFHHPRATALVIQIQRVLPKPVHFLVNAS